jgi:hypothetical protein
MSNTHSETRREVLRDSAALNRLLAAAIRAHLLGDEQRLENLLGQVTPGACDRLAALVAAEANDRSLESDLAPVVALRLLKEA